MFFKKFGDLVIGLFFLVLAIGLFAAASVLPPSLLGGIGSDFMPRVLAVGTGVLAVLQVLSGVKVMRAYSPDAGGQAPPEERPEYLRVLATIAVFTVYIFLLQPVGFLPCSTVYLFAQMLILAPKGKRSPLLFAVISVACSVAVYFIFRNGLSVMLPAGILA